MSEDEDAAIAADVPGREGESLRDLVKRAGCCKAQVTTGEKTVASLVNLVLDDGPLTLSGKVVWRRAARNGADAGLGIRFGDLPSAVRERLDALVDSLPEEQPEVVEPELDYSLADEV